MSETVPDERLSPGWRSSGAITWGQSVTGYGHSWAPLPVTVDGQTLSINFACPREESDG